MRSVVLCLFLLLTAIQPASAVECGQLCVDFLERQAYEAKRDYHAELRRCEGEDTCVDGFLVFEYRRALLIVKDDSGHDFDTIKHKDAQSLLKNANLRVVLPKTDWAEWKHIADRYTSDRREWRKRNR